MPPAIHSDDNGSVSWRAADVAADVSGETTLLGGDIRPTIIHHSQLSIYN
jgi:hypothetical protein